MHSDWPEIKQCHNERGKVNMYIMRDLNSLETQGIVETVAENTNWLYYTEFMDVVSVIKVLTIKQNLSRLVNIDNSTEIMM